MKTTGHHTCKSEGNYKEEAPYIGGGFAGGGYYFWDNSIDTAHWWGQTHYNGNYAVCECRLAFEESEGDALNDELLDLVGKREHQIWFRTRGEKIESKATDGQSFG